MSKKFKVKSVGMYQNVNVAFGNKNIAFKNGLYETDSQEEAEYLAKKHYVSDVEGLGKKAISESKPEETADDSDNKSEEINIDDMKKAELIKFANEALNLNVDDKMTVKEIKAEIEKLKSEEATE